MSTENEVKLGVPGAVEAAIFRVLVQCYHYLLV